ncbi:hypothetical protein DFH05DRAFT_1172006 [Lentinula detonsa]|uniref:Uncharacterized protein n=1 Tax=Lentinula detonsa TaxID=2804962 RepID=A0A9W8P0M1_9AGAR|nr:hypothetical protein DFH05DRAFT_1172006 [Lentinula detonsa]
MCTLHKSWWLYFLYRASKLCIFCITQSSQPLSSMMSFKNQTVMQKSSPFEVIICESMCLPAADSTSIEFIPANVNPERTLDVRFILKGFYQVGPLHPFPHHTYRLIVWRWFERQVPPFPVYPRDRCQAPAISIKARYVDNPGRRGSALSAHLSSALLTTAVQVVPLNYAKYPLLLCIKLKIKLVSCIECIEDGHSQTNIDNAEELGS